MDTALLFLAHRPSERSAWLRFRSHAPDGELRLMRPLERPFWAMAWRGRKFLPRRRMHRISGVSTQTARFA